MKVTFLVPTRNKVAWVERAANSYLRQTYSPMEIVFFDQNSTDGTLEILDALAAKYDGPNTVRVLNCPNEGIGGTAAGMNADIAWVHERIEGDVILWGNADDFAYPTRTAKTVRAFEEFNPSWLSCCQFFMRADLLIQGETVVSDKRDREITFAEAVQFQVGSSGALAYARDLWDKYKPMRGVEQNDIILPYLSFLERGMRFIAEPLHAYVFHADPNNQGLNGRVLAATDGAHKMQLLEANAFNLVSNWMSLLTRLQESAAKTDVLPAAMANINTMLWANVQAWEHARRELTLQGVAPIGLHARPGQWDGAERRRFPDGFPEQ